MACGTQVPTPLTPLIQMPVESSLTMRAVARSGGRGLGRGARGARAEALRVDDRLAEVDVVLLGVLEVPVDVLGELRALALEGRQLAEHAERQRGDHVDAAAVRAPGRARDVLDALAAEAQVVARARDQVRGGDAGAVVADVGQDVLRLGVELIVVDRGDLADAAAGGDVRRHVLDALALVVDLAVVLQRLDVLLAGLQVLRLLRIGNGHVASSGIEFWELRAVQAPSETTRAKRRGIG